jgi:AraC family transcriptional regulator
MSQPLENPIIFRPLYRSALIVVREYRCRACRGGPAEEEYSDSNNIVLMRHGVFCKHFGRRTVTADVNQAVFFSRGSSYRVSHPSDCGDRGTVLEPAPCVLRDIVRELDHTIDDHPEKPFPFVTGPCDTGVFWRHREFVLRLERAASEPLDPMWVDETALQLIADVLEAAFARRGVSPKRRRQGTEADHADRVEAAKSYLASRLGERITLDDVARAVHASPFHLARVFHERVGVPVHRYLTRLRLRASLERLQDGADDLTALALDLGFSSHSHFTDAFRREFGLPPSEMRRAAGRTVRELSKNLEV